MAGRIPHPWYRQAKDAWYVHLHGKTIRLGKDKDEAFRRFHRLMSEQGQESSVASAVDPTLTVGELAEQYLADLKRRTDERTFYVARCYLKPFLTRCGNVKVKTLKKHHIETAIREHGAWNDTTENHVKSRIVALFNWGVEQGLIDKNPVKGIRKSRAKSRGSEVVIDTAVSGRLKPATDGRFKTSHFEETLIR